MYKITPRSSRIRLFTALALWGALSLMLAAAAAQAATTLTWYGQSAYKITTPEGHVLLIDPWISNPKNPAAQDDLAGLTKVDYILVSHGHFDHVGDSVEIAKKTGAHLIANSDLGAALVQYDGYPKEQAGLDTLGNAGGTLTLLGGEVTVTYVPAVHGSSITATNPPGAVESGGNPLGFVITIKNGPTIYHTGDTDLFSDMALIGRHHKIDLMLCCIGDHFTMGPEAAAEAVKLVNPAVVVPMHYGTFSALTGTPEAFAAALHRQGTRSKLRVLQVHDTISL